MADIHDLVRPPRKHWSRAGERALRSGKARHRRTPRIRWSELRLAALAGLLLGLAYAELPGLPSPHPAAAGANVHFGLCDLGAGAPCVVDGDTFRLGDDKIRIADIDTPETHPARCAYEAELGARATDRMRALLNAGPFVLKAIDRDEDRYGRKLRVVTRDGESLGGVLVTEGMAREWTGHREPWC